MALILKENEILEDRLGNVYGEAYIVIDKIDCDKQNETCFIITEFYYQRDYYDRT